MVFCPGALRLGDWIVECEIVNISHEGANVRATQVLEPVSLVTLIYDPCGEFECDVTWQDGETLGLAFRERGSKTRDLYQTLVQNPEGTKGAREVTRVQVLWSGTLRSRETSHDCQIVNVSLSGVKVHVSNPPDVVSAVTLMIDRFGDFQCEIIWRKGDVMGLKFLADVQTIEDTIGQAVPQIRRHSG